MRRSMIATLGLMALGAVAFAGSASAAVVGPMPALTTSTDAITQVRMDRRMMRPRMSSRRMSRMSGRQFQHRRMWGN